MPDRHAHRRAGHTATAPTSSHDRRSRAPRRSSPAHARSRGNVPTGRRYTGID